jgi:hypothetical protein
VIGLVTEDVWHAGRLIVPAGAEVHGHAALDRARERLAVQGAWKIVWRTPDAANGTELSVQGLALDREFDSASGRWGEADGSAGLRGQVVKTSDDPRTETLCRDIPRERHRRASGGQADRRLRSAMPRFRRRPPQRGVGRHRRALREHAQVIRESIARDGFYLRVPAGKPFDLYVTQTLDLSQARRSPPLAHRAAPSHP